MLYHKLPYFLVRFSNPLKPVDIASFRKQIIAGVGYKHQHFHNHNKDGHIFHYPPVQYKSLNGYAALLFVGKGMDDIASLLSVLSQITWQDQQLDVHNYKSYHYNLVQLPTQMDYRLRHWLPLQKQNLKAYNALEEDQERIELLKKILIGNLLSFAKGVGWEIEHSIIIEKLSIQNQNFLAYKNLRFLGFDIHFSCNLFLPPYIGLGKATGKGFGTLFPTATHSKTATHNLTEHER